jgi:hypothetical protein
MIPTPDSEYRRDEATLPPVEKVSETVMRRQDPELLLASGRNGQSAYRMSSYALNVTRALTPIASRISWRRAMATV